MTLEEAIVATKEHMNTCDSKSEEYQVLQILLTCAEICQEAVIKLN